MMDNRRRAELGVIAVRAAASVTNVWRQDTAQTSITDVLAYIAHACDLGGLEPHMMFEAGLESYHGDMEDGPRVDPVFDFTASKFSDLGVWGE